HSARHQDLHHATVGVAVHGQRARGAGEGVRPFLGLGADLNLHVGARQGHFTTSWADGSDGGHGLSPRGTHTPAFGTRGRLLYPRDPADRTLASTDLVPMPILSACPGRRHHAARRKTRSTPSFGSAGGSPPPATRSWSCATSSRRRWRRRRQPPVACSSPTVGGAWLP